MSATIATFENRFGSSGAGAVTAGLVTRAVIAADLGVAPRTVIRYEEQGMPAIHLGKQRLYDIVKVRAWVMSHERRTAVPVLGRPAKQRRYA